MSSALSNEPSTSTATVAKEEAGVLKINGSDTTMANGPHASTTEAGVDEAEEEGVYEVEAIVGSRKRKGRQQYLIKWKGYPDEENTWEDVNNVHAEDLVEDYWRKHEASQMPKKESKLKRKRSNLDHHTVKVEDDVPSKKPADGTTHTADRAPTGSEPPANTSDMDYSVNWEECVDKVETVERATNNSLLVYLLWKNGKQTIHHSSQIRERCPHKLLDFYEAHLRFTKMDADAE
ncbi:hypothetical protein SYNPS1DRAFT_28431 [Syncephalis pseudoplumigaleata]|uniref:Chromo domain-containing protein n=1 Tax=Syncephalis pseudoplumigaleata TaxID=1712513 RepID=A0A4P9Z0P6_9FUNG|nr:hypothetical protein SYNPS1DRAFT_28431 [Syncephalis pseudoplumigaleata]|eukprot:RKP25845.1 hypothetical protein SYNPS1DRAFT_28431 [Syncephalis pseudoplumigaleata]